MSNMLRWTFPTILSASRIAFLIPLSICLFSEFEHHRLWAGAVIILGVATDFLDGFLARRWREVSELGKIVDPLADKISVAALAVMLVLLGDLPAWFFVLLIVRDGAIVLGGSYIRKRKGIITQSNWPGKVAVTFVALLLFVLTVQVQELNVFVPLLLWSSVLLLILSSGIYVQRLFVGFRKRN